MQLRSSLALCVSLTACTGPLAAPISRVPSSAPTLSSAQELAPTLGAAVQTVAPSRMLPPPDNKPGKARRPKGERGPSDPRFAAWHFGGGVVSTVVIQSMAYSIANSVGHRGQGLEPVIGALVIAAFAPPILNYTVQWASGRTVAPRRDRFWPGFLVRQVVHLGVFAGALLGGADFNKPGHMAAIVVGEAFVNSGLATMTAELARRPLPPPSMAQLGAGAGPSSAPGSAASNTGRRPVQFVVPIVEIQF